MLLGCPTDNLSMVTIILHTLYIRRKGRPGISPPPKKNIHFLRRAVLEHSRTCSASKVTQNQSQSIAFQTFSEGARPLVGAYP